MSGTYTPPDYAVWLNAIDAAITAKIAGSDVTSYSIGGMQFVKQTLDQMLNHRERILALYNAELAGGNVTITDMSNRREVFQ
jgi:hypothetical protein